MRRMSKVTLALVVDIALLFLLPLLFFFGVLFTNQFSIPYDIIDQAYMYHYFAADAFKHGQLPLWTPYLFSGYPHVGDPQSAMFYPPNMLMYLLSPVSGLPYRLLEWQLVFHYFLAGLFMYLWAKRVFKDRFSSLVTAIIFMFNGFLVSRAQHLMVVNTLVWFPLILFLFDRALREKRFLFAVLSGVVFGLAILAGHAQASLHIFYVLLGFLVYQLYQPLSQRRYKHALRMTFLFATTMVIALGLSAVQILPALEFSMKSSRAALNYGEAAWSSLMPQHLITLFVPNFFSTEGPGSYWAFGDICETYLYLGIFPLVLASLSIFYVKRKEIWAVLGFALFALFMAFGHYAFLQQVAYFFTLGFNKIRRPVNFMFFFDFAIALLAGYGAKFLFDEHREGYREALERFVPRLSQLCLFVVALITLFYWGLAQAIGTPNQHNFSSIINGLVLLSLLLLCSLGIIVAKIKHVFPCGLIKGLALGLIVFDLFTFGSLKPFNTASYDLDTQIGPDFVYDRDNDVIRFLQADSDYLKNNFYRIEVKDAGSLWENGGNVWKIQSTWGYNTLRLKDYEGFRNLIEGYDSKLLDLLNVKYIVSPKSISELDPQITEDQFELVFDQGYKIYGNKDFLPRAFVVYQAMVIKDKEELLTVLQSPSFNPRESVILQEDCPLLFRLGNAPLLKDSIVDIVHYSRTKIVIEASLLEKGFLVMSEIYYPGWKAFVDGKESHIYKADYILRAVYLDQGAHEVMFIYDPLSFRVGLYITVGTLFLVLLVALFGFKSFIEQRSEKNQNGNRL